jgi:hypothetical protein
MSLKELGILFLTLAFLIALHQYSTYGSWFELKDVHHELFIACFGFAGVLLLWLYNRRRRR